MPLRLRLAGARPTALLALPAVWLLAGCSDAAPDVPTLDAAPLTVEQELRLGSVDDSENALTWFRSLVVGPDGRIFTAHPMENAVKLHDAQGNLVRTVGREGEGPGEFKNVGTMGLIGDTLWVMDFSTYRLSFFDLDGGLIGTRALRLDMGETPEERPPRPQGLFHDGTISGARPSWSREVAAGTITESAVLRLDSLNNVLDTVAVSSLENRTLAIMNPESPSGFGSFQRQPFSDTEIVELSRFAPEVVRVQRHAAAADGLDSLRITKLTFDGDTLFSRSFSYDPVPLEPATVDSIVREIGEGVSQSPMRGAPTAARAEELARQAIYAPAFHPPISELVIGRDGTVYLRREDTGDSISEWTVLSGEGAVLGTVRLPSTFRMMAADREHVWGMELDELDVPYLIRYSIGGEAGP